MITLLLFRHSYAQSLGEVPSDWHRGLTQMGVTTAQRVMRGLVTTHGFKPEAGLVSPYPRAGQTMAILQQACLDAGMAALPVTAWEGCCSNSDTATAVATIEAMSAQTIALVGHQPFIGDLALRLTGREVGEVNPCDCLWLESHAGAWRFRQHLSYSDFL